MGIFELDPWSRGQGRFWQKPASWFFSTPRFLAAQRSAVSSRREEIAFLRWRVNTQGSADPCANLGVLVGNCYPVERFYDFCQHSRSGLQLHTGLQFVQRSNCRATNLAVFRRRKAFLLCKNPCGAGCNGGRGSSLQRTQSPRKEISRGNLLCAKSGLPSLSYSRRLSAQKYVTTPDWENLCTGQPRGARGTAVPLFREESRGTPSKGFLWATSSRRLDTALLCAAKKRGVEKWTAWWSPPDSLWRLPPRTAETYSSSCSGSTRSIEMTRLPSSTLMRMTPCVSRL